MSATGVKPGSQCARIVEYLSDGRPHSMSDVHGAVGFCRLNSRVSELRSRGYQIDCTREGSDYIYRLVASPAQPDMPNPDGSGPRRGEDAALEAVRDGVSGGAGESDRAQEPPSVPRVVDGSPPLPLSPVQLELGVAA